MTRTAREKGQSGIYHVMFRGINRQEIFHDEDDCVRFLETLERYKRQSKLGILSWCLMGNHVHLFVREGDEDLSVTMKRVEAIEKFRKYSEEANDDRCLDEHLVRKLTDREAKEEIEKAVKEYSVQEIKTLARQERDRVIKIIKDIDGLTQRQAARILGISPNLIFKV